MRRFRTRRKRLAARLLLPFAALMMTTTLTAAFAAAPAPSPSPKLDASARNVKFGERVTLRGSFSDAPNTALSIDHRARGSKRWRKVRGGHTGADGRYAVRIKPRRSGFWRAVLDGAAAGRAAPRSSTDTRVNVRSRTNARVVGGHAKLGERIKVRGKVRPTGANRRVKIKLGGQTDSVRTGRNGKFSVQLRARRTGTRKVKVISRSNRIARGSRAKAGQVTVYRAAAASWYGPGLYGNPTACGGTLTPSTLGVAHKTMPCGTKLRLRYGGRSVAVRVIDRGPYSGNREFDLTAATKQRLGFPDTGTVLSSK